jgi:hypothetical protein
MPVKPATPESEIRSLFEASLGKMLARSHLNKQAGCDGKHPNPSYLEGMVQSWLHTKSGRPYLKNIKAEEYWGMAQVVEHLPSKSEALSFNHSTRPPLKYIHTYIYIYIYIYIKYYFKIILSKI